MEIDYYSKYLKYKNKYIQLKEQIGGIDCANHANHAIATCSLIPGCTKSVEAGKCKQTKCINNSMCNITRGCNYNDKINKCVPNCEKFNNEKDYPKIKGKYSEPENKMYCNFVDECTFDDRQKKCIIKDIQLRKEHLENS